MLPLAELAEGDGAEVSEELGVEECSAEDAAAAEAAAEEDAGAA